MTSTLRAPCDEGVIAAGPDHEPCSPNVGRWVLVATILGSTLAFLDATVVNVALPVIQSSLNASATEIQWVVESYALFLAALLLLGGSLGDHFGRRRGYTAGSEYPGSFVDRGDRFPFAGNRFPPRDAHMRRIGMCQRHCGCGADRGKADHAGAAD